MHGMENDKLEIARLNLLTLNKLPWVTKTEFLLTITNEFNISQTVMRIKNNISLRIF